LNISAEQWTSFMDDLNEICQEFSLPADDARDLTTIITSLMDDCVCAEGEPVRNHPGNPTPLGDSLYARIGGVYPIALFADRLVDAMLTDSRVAVPLDGVKRAEPSLKYFFTEFCCCIAGGPETMTSRHDPETFLKLSSEEIFYLLSAAMTAADHISCRTLRNDLAFALYQNLALIEDPARATPLNDALCFSCPKRHIRTYADMRRSLQDDARALCLPMRWMYVPGGLAFLDDGMTTNQQSHMHRIIDQHGFRRVATPSVKSATEAAAGGGIRGV
jgi:hypothetical protein